MIYYCFHEHGILPHKINDLGRREKLLIYALIDEKTIRDKKYKSTGGKKKPPRRNGVR